MDKREQTQRLSEIVNKHISKLTTEKTSEFDFSCGNNLFSPYGDKVINLFFKIFDTKAASQKHEPKSLFHYKKFEYAYDFIENEYISLSALSNYTNFEFDDVKEYEHFFEVAKVKTRQSFIKQQKSDLFVFCLTENNTTERFWKEYADYGRGLCLELEIKDIIKQNEQNATWYNLNKICYDDGNEFQFFADMQNEIHTELGRYLLIDGIAKFGALYKRKSYEWEQETRLLICKECGGTKVDITEDNRMIIPFDNSIFSIKIKSITPGKNLDSCKKQKTKKLAEEKGIKYNELND